MSTPPRITPTVTPIAERHAADAAIERASESGEGVVVGGRRRPGARHPMTTETDIEKLVPWGLTAREYAALALLLLDQAGLCVRDQKRVTDIVEECPGHARVIAAE